MGKSKLNEFYKLGLTYKDIRRFDYTMKNFIKNENKKMKELELLGLGAFLTPISRETFLQDLKHGAEFNELIERYQKESKEAKEFNALKYEADYINKLRGFEVVTPDDLSLLSSSDFAYVDKIIGKIEEYQRRGFEDGEANAWDLLFDFIRKVNGE